MPFPSNQEDNTRVAYKGKNANQEREDTRGMQVSIYKNGHSTKRSNRSSSNRCNIIFQILDGNGQNLEPTYANVNSVPEKQLNYINIHNFNCVKRNCSIQLHHTQQKL